MLPETVNAERDVDGELHVASWTFVLVLVPLVDALHVTLCVRHELVAIVTEEALVQGAAAVGASAGEFPQEPLADLAV